MAAVEYHVSPRGTPGFTISTTLTNGNVVRQVVPAMALVDATGNSFSSSSGLPVTPATGAVYSILGSRPFTPVTGTVANGTSAYATGQVIGSLGTIATGLPAGTLITGGTFRLRFRVADTTTGPAVAMMVFNANPSGSTITDGVALSIAAADRDKTVGPQGGFASFGFIAGGVYQTTAALPRTTVDASGNLYFLIGAIGANQFGTANIIGWQADGTY